MNEYSRLRRLNHLFAQIDAIYHEAALHMGLSDSAMMVLYTLCIEEGSCPIGEIINQSNISKQTLNSALRTLEKEGLIRLETDHGRRKRACLTEEGNARCKETVVHLIEIENRIFDAWTGEEREAYLSLTQKYRDMLKTGVEEMK